MGTKIKFGAVVSAIGLLVALMVWAVLGSSQLLDEMRAKGREATSESFAIGKHLQKSVMDLNARIFALSEQGDRAEWSRFEADWAALGAWIDVQPLSTPHELEVRSRIKAAGVDYHRAAAAIATRTQARPGEGASTAGFGELQRQTERLVEEASELAAAHREALRDVVSNYTHRLTSLRNLLLGALALLVACGVGLGVAVQRQWIAPLQVQLVESEALLERQEKLASLGVLAAGVAHEIRNPLTAIKAWLFMHQRGLNPGTQEHSDAEVVSDELARLERIVKDFLNFARPSEPQLQLVPADQPLREVRDLLARPLEKHGIKLEIEPTTGREVRVDPQQIKQVLINLVRNAAEAIGEQGIVRLRARPDRVRLGGREADVVVLEVSDTGRGIPPEVQKRLFDPFFSTKDTGTGLGLSIAARIVEKHGGVLQYQTEVNRGTTFGVVLLQADAHAHANSAH